MADETVETLTAKLAERDAKLALAARTEADLQTATKARDDALAALETAKNEAKTTKEQGETRLTEAQKDSQAKLVKAELKAAAIAAGAKDYKDVLALINQSEVKLDANGELENGGALIAALKLAKPYFFGGAQSTHTDDKKTVPPENLGKKKAKDMTSEEWAAERKRLGLKR